MARKLNIDALELIELVEKRPCLWDKSSKGYKNKSVKEDAWKEICQFLTKDFHRLETQEKQVLYEMVIEKWRNLRDAFVRSLKKKISDPFRKKYIYHKNLQFLLQQVFTTESNFVEDSQQGDALDHQLSISDRSSFSLNEDIKHEPEDITLDETRYESDQEIENASRLSLPLASSRKRKRNIVGIQDVEFLEAETDTKRMDDDDEAFFRSLTPYIKSLTVDEKLQFRMDVLSLIQGIHKKRQLHLDNASPPAPARQLDS